MFFRLFFQKPNGPKLRPPKSSTRSSSSNPEELEIEIAEVLYGMKTQSQVPSRKEIVGNDLNKSSSDAKSRVSSPISNATTIAPQSSALLLQNSSSSAAPLSAVGPFLEQFAVQISLFLYRLNHLQSSLFLAPSDLSEKNLVKKFKYWAF